MQKKKNTTGGSNPLCRQPEQERITPHRADVLRKIVTLPQQPHRKYIRLVRVCDRCIIAFVLLVTVLYKKTTIVLYH